MRTVIIRDDDTNALTPVACLETLYRPFLARGLPVNLATVPAVRCDARTPEGKREGFLPSARFSPGETVPLAANRALTDYLHDNRGYQVVQHGCHHDTFEFDSRDRRDVVRRLELGRQRLDEAGFDGGSTFVAPHDRISRIAYREIADRFRVISTGWFELRRLPLSWRPRYLWHKLRRRRHWQVGSTRLLTHPGCLLSYTRPYSSILPLIRERIAQQELTVLVTHWWEYFRDDTPDEAFIAVLHATAEYLASDPSIRVIPFRALAEQTNPSRATALADNPDVVPSALATK